ncbi:hypothetical protein IW262DRAFT_1280085 [Armillaria fumosa]|nr:hypothetical protein IW262DRAFT_1280085 [Armillaria fumosa]
MAGQANISPSSGTNSLQAPSFASQDVPSSGVDLPTKTISPSTSLNSQSGATIPPGAKPVSADSQATSKRRRCGCKCDADCNCDCLCKNHCVCPPHTSRQGCGTKCQHKCDKKCGSLRFRNLVVCLDGTSNQFGHRNTNVVELHSRILRGDPDVPQLTFYSSGIGTYVPPLKFSPAHWLRLLDNIIDMAIAWNFKHIVEEAYQWLADHYRDGDRIYLFGFSRGAYQIRALSGMIEKVSFFNSFQFPWSPTMLIHSHSEIEDDAEAEALALNFKRTFSWPSVKIHFLGAWDTVSSVGIVREQPLSLTRTSTHICFIRHGLALDERRVKFLPEYFNKGLIPTFERQSQSTESTDVEEVWFAGSHSDIGNHLPRTFDLSLPPLLWMEDQASAVGLKLSSQSMEGEWKWGGLHNGMPTKSLKGPWWFLEHLPITRLLYTDERSTTRHSQIPFQSV